MLWIKRIIIEIHRWAFQPKVVDLETASFGWGQGKDEKPKIRLFTYPGCPACEEIRGWLGVEWIPFEELVVDAIEPPQILLSRGFQGYRLHKVKNKKTKEVKILALYPEFPQMELSYKDDVKTIVTGIQQMKDESVKFLQDKNVPGFALPKAPNPEKSSEERDAQLNQILNEVEV